jgi:hypothetical protein
MYVLQQRINNRANNLTQASTWPTPVDSQHINSPEQWQAGKKVGRLIAESRKRIGKNRTNVWEPMYRNSKIEQKRRQTVGNSRKCRQKETGEAGREGTETLQRNEMPSRTVPTCNVGTKRGSRTVTNSTE